MLAVAMQVAHSAQAQIDLRQVESALMGHDRVEPFERDRVLGVGE